MEMKRSKLVCLLSVLGLLIVGSDGRKGKFQNKADNGAPIPLFPGVAILSQTISIGGEMIRSVISPTNFYLQSLNAV